MFVSAKLCFPCSFIRRLASTTTPRHLTSSSLLSTMLLLQSFSVILHVSILVSCGMSAIEAATAICHFYFHSQLSIRQDTRSCSVFICLFVLFSPFSIAFTVAVAFAFYAAPSYSYCLSIAMKLASTKLSFSSAATSCMPHIQ